MSTPQPEHRHRKGTPPSGLTGDPSASLTAGWPEIDASLLDDGRRAVPAFPLDVLPPPWRAWVADMACSANVPIDYVAQSVLGAVAGLSGAGAAVRITPAWSEPLILWQALIGGSSSGKSPALAPVRGLLASLEDEWRAGDASGQAVRSQFVVGDTAIEAIAEIVAGNPRGVILWRDEPSAWLAALGNDDSDRAHWLEAWVAGSVSIERRGAPLHLKKFPVSIIGTAPPERLADMLQGSADGLAARFLYAWPDLAPFCPLSGREIASDGALAMLRRIPRKTHTPDDPLVLLFDERGLQAFNGFLAGLHAEVKNADGILAGWLGKGRGTVARLAGALELLAWSGSGEPGRPGHIGREQVEAAASLWTNYFRPHASAVFDRAIPTDLKQRVRRVVRWLKLGGSTEVSREDIRRNALCQSVTGAETDMVLYRLMGAGILRLVAGESSPRGGPRVRRWQVNPALTAVEGVVDQR